MTGHEDRTWGSITDAVEAVMATLLPCVWLLAVATLALCCDGWKTSCEVWRGR